LTYQFIIGSYPVPFKDAIEPGNAKNGIAGIGQGTHPIEKFGRKPYLNFIGSICIGRRGSPVALLALPPPINCAQHTPNQPAKYNYDFQNITVEPASYKLPFTTSCFLNGLL
jgi:hypothetical protein